MNKKVSVVVIEVVAHNARITAMVYALSGIRTIFSQTVNIVNPWKADASHGFFQSRNTIIFLVYYIGYMVKNKSIILSHKNNTYKKPKQFLGFI